MRAFSLVHTCIPAPTLLQTCPRPWSAFS